VYLEFLHSMLAPCWWGNCSHLPWYHAPLPADHPCWSSQPSLLPHKLFISCCGTE